jgi:ankyrin repeat protein
MTQNLALGLLAVVVGISMVAISAHETEIALELIRRGADVEIPERQDGMTPLMFVVQAGPVELVEPLLAAGADLDAQDRMGYTAVDYAGSPELVALLEDAQGR